MQIVRRVRITWKTTSIRYKTSIARLKMNIQNIFGTNYTTGSIGSLLQFSILRSPIHIEITFF